MRPSAPRAWFTEVMAPNVVARGITSRNRNMMKEIKEAIVIAPAATRKPPTPRTTSSESCRAMPETGTTIEEILAMRTPIP